ncbi:hypothetical protein MYU51_019553 [Penicillium brevicompactum]
MNRRAISVDPESGAVEFKQYSYTPSLPAAAASVIVFATLTALHAWRMHNFRAVYFTAFTIGGLFETLGYSGRVWSHFDQDALGGFIIQEILILVAPALYAASIYMVLGRLLRSLRAEHLSFIQVKWMTKVFVIGDIISFTLQAGGGGIQSAGSLKLYEIGEKVIIVGLFVQIAVFGFFMATALICHCRLAGASNPITDEGVIPWRRHLYVLYITSMIILLRSIFRVIEYVQGNGGYLISHEIFLYIFDAFFMAVVMLMFFIWYIGDLDPKATEKRPESGVGLIELDQEESHGIRV